MPDNVIAKYPAVMLECDGDSPGDADKLLGLKENVIIGRLIPARCILPDKNEREVQPVAEAPPNP